MNEEFMQNLFRIAEELSRAGWAEANAGNISVRLRPEEYPTDPAAGPWQPLAIAIPALAGEQFLVTAKGCQIRNVPHFPRRDCGVLELNGDGFEHGLGCVLDEAALARITVEKFALER